MTTLREAAQQALDALEGWNNYGKWVWPESALEQAKRNTTEALNVLREALAQPEPEPVGYMPVYELSRLQSGHDGRLRSAKFGASALDWDVAVYTTTPQRQPLTDEEMRALWENHGYKSALCMRFARAIERAHGIGGDK